MRVKAQVAMVMNLDKCIGCHTCSVTCKQVWTNRPGHRVRLVQQRRDQPRAGLPAPVGRPGALERRLGARPQGPAAAEGRRPGQEAADDLLQPRPARDRRLLRAVHLRLRDARRRAARRPRPGRAPALAAHRQADGRHVGAQLGRGPGRRPGVGAEGPAPAGHRRSRCGMTYEQAFMFFLPRICEHCLNPSCVASLPVRARCTSARRTASCSSTRTAAAAGATASRAARTRRSTSTTAPARPRSARSATRGSRSASRRSARRPASGASATSASCSTTPTASQAAASVPDERDLLAAQRDVFLDPEDPEVREAAHARRHPARLDRRARGARRSTTWRCAGASRCRCTPSSARCRWSGTCRRCRRWSRRWRPTATRPTPTTSSARSTTCGSRSSTSPTCSAPATSTSSAASCTGSRRCAPTCASARCSARSTSSCPARVGLTGPELERMYRLLAIADYEDRYVIPQAHAELGERLMQEQGGCGLDFDGGPGNCGAVDPRPDTLLAGRALRRRELPPARHPQAQRAPRSMRRRHADPPPAPWALLSFLLRYPDADVAAARDRDRRRGDRAARRAGARRARALPRGLDRRPDRAGGALRRDVRPAPPREPVPDLLRARRHARARHGAAAPEEALPRRRAADGVRPSCPTT